MRPDPRSVLFDVDVPDYEDLANTTKSFEPYQALWLTADVWIKKKAAWLDGDFLDIDADNLPQPGRQSQDIGERLNISWSQDQPANDSLGQRLKYYGSVKNDILTADVPAQTVGHHSSVAAPPVLTSYRDDPMWTDLGLHVLPVEGRLGIHETPIQTCIPCFLHLCHVPFYVTLSWCT